MHAYMICLYIPTVTDTTTSAGQSSSLSLYTCADLASVAAHLGSYCISLVTTIGVPRNALYSVSIL